ncbi:MAG TPA: hypothetical protein DCS83_04030 [Prevotella sp.]|nr:hypothetical protein [Prevotella sp.]
MERSEQFLQQIDRFIRKIAEKFPVSEETSLITDIHVKSNQDTGELIAYNDDEEEITRVTIEEWINYQDENFFDEAATVLRDELRKNQDLVNNMGILKPYSFVLECEDDKNDSAELYIADDDTVILGGDLMPGLDDDLNKFFEKLTKE